MVGTLRFAHPTRRRSCSIQRTERLAQLLLGKLHQSDKRLAQIRDVPGMKKKPSTSELLDWLKLLMVEDISIETLASATPRS